MSESKNSVEFCSKCHKMYGHSSFNGMCSLCFKNAEKSKIKEVNTPEKAEREMKLQKKETQIEIKKAEGQGEKEQGKQKEGDGKGSRVEKMDEKCIQCRKRTGILGYKCKHCEKNYCRLHRLPEEHSCDVDFISLGKKQLQIENPSIPKPKIQQF